MKVVKKDTSSAKDLNSVTEREKAHRENLLKWVIFYLNITPF